MSMNSDSTKHTSPSGRARVSVVVPSYNHASFIEKCLRSIIRQTLAPAQLVVIDDGSHDGSPKIIEQTLKECSFPCELIARSNKGLCATLNEGLERCRGAEYFAYLGSDDAWLPNFLWARVELLESRPSAVLGYGHAYIIDDRDRILECTLDWARYVDGNVQQMLLRDSGPVSSTVMYRQAVLERQGWNEKTKLEDYELYLRLSAEGDFAFDPQVLSAWRQHGYNTSRNLTLMIDECLEAQCQVRQRFGLGTEELRASQMALKWRFADLFIRNGEKSKGLALMLDNLRGAPSLSSVLRMQISLLVPHRVLQWRKNVLRWRAGKRYGSLPL